MARREYRTTFRCAESGCRETQFFTSTTRADEAALYKRQKEHPFRCSRHADPARNLRPGNEQTTQVLIASRVRAGRIRSDGDGEPPYLSGLFWLREGQDHGGSGYTFGPGFNAHASDFSEGTRLVVTARIEIPCPCDCTCPASGRRDDDGTPGLCDSCRMGIHPRREGGVTDEQA